MAVANPTAAGESNEVDLSAKLATREVASMKNTSHLDQTAPLTATVQIRWGSEGCSILSAYALNRDSVVFVCRFVVAFRCLDLGEPALPIIREDYLVGLVNRRVAYLAN